MAKLDKQFRNDESRTQCATSGTLRETMPGSQDLNGDVHTVGYIPDGALLKGWSAYLGDRSENWVGGVTVAIGTASNPTLFATSQTIGEGGTIVNDKLLPFEHFFPVGEEVVMQVLVGDTNPIGSTGVLRFTLDYTEVNTTTGEYTS